VHPVSSSRCCCPSLDIRRCTRYRQAVVAAPLLP
jgi:hypothetical protein